MTKAQKRRRQLNITGKFAIPADELIIRIHFPDNTRRLIRGVDNVVQEPQDAVIAVPEEALVISLSPRCTAHDFVNQLMHCMQASLSRIGLTIVSCELETYPDLLGNITDWLHEAWAGAVPLNSNRITTLIRTLLDGVLVQGRECGLFRLTYSAVVSPHHEEPGIFVRFEHVVSRPGTPRHHLLNNKKPSPVLKTECELATHLLETSEEIFLVSRDAAAANAAAGSVVHVFAQ